MSDQWTLWLNAYIDGELEADRTVELEAHLEECVQCRKDLQEMLAVRELLQACPMPEHAGSDARFARSVVRRLPDRRATVLLPGGDLFRVVWHALPFALAGLLAVGQAVLTVSGLVWLSLRAGALDSALLAFISTSVAPSRSLAGAIGGALTNNLSGAAAQVLGTISPLVWIGFGYFATLCGIGLLYWSWIASWWLRRKRSSMVTADRQ
jgi:anti-sigma factor RsiW